MKIGISIPATRPISEVLWFSTQAEKAGVDEVWIPDDAPDPPYGDVFMAATAVALKTLRVKIGIAVVNPYTRHPAIIASSMLALENLSRGRSILGISTGGQSHLVQVGLKPFFMPIRTVGEAVGVIRRLSNGDNVTFKGASFELQNVHLEKSRRKIPVYIAARSEGLLKLTGRIADGLILNCPTDPAFYKYAIKKVEEGALEARRNLSKIKVAGLTDFLVMKNGSEAKRTIRALAARRISFLPIGVARISGISEELLTKIQKMVKCGKIMEAAIMLPDELIDRVALAGDPNSCVKQSVLLAKAGLDQLIFSMRAKPKESLQLLLKEVIPKLKRELQ